MTLAGAWRSKAEWSGLAHFVGDDGVTACAGRLGPRGIPMAELFKTTWAELREQDHLCKWCREVAPRECRCGICSVRPFGKGGNRDA